MSTVGENKRRSITVPLNECTVQRGTDPTKRTWRGLRSPIIYSDQDDTPLHKRLLDCAKELATKEAEKHTPKESPLFPGKKLPPSTGSFLKDAYSYIKQGISIKEAAGGIIVTAGTRVALAAVENAGAILLDLIVRWLKSDVVDVVSVQGRFTPHEFKRSYPACEISPKLPKEYYYYTLSSPTITSPFKLNCAQKDASDTEYARRYCPVLLRIDDVSFILLPMVIDSGSYNQLGNKLVKALRKIFLEGCGGINTFYTGIDNIDAVNCLIFRRKDAAKMKAILAKMYDEQAAKYAGTVYKDADNLRKPEYEGAERLDKLPIHSQTRKELEEEIEFVNRVGIANMPTSRTIVLTGPPGTCKTSIAYRIPYCCTTVGVLFPSKKPELEHLKKCGLKGLVVIVDEADGLSGFTKEPGRNKQNVVANGVDQMNRDLSGMPTKSDDAIDKRDVHNYLTGPEAPPYFNILTTNYPKRFSSAVSRLGRVKKFIYVGKVDDAGIKYFLKQNFNYDAPEDIVFPDRKANQIYDLVERVELDGIESVVEKLVNEPVLEKEGYQGPDDEDEE